MWWSRSARRRSAFLQRRSLLCALVLASLACLACAAPAEWPEAREERARVAVVGGGIAGLVAAWELEQRGISVHLFEMTDRYGGRIATARYGPGLTGEYGMEEIWSKNPLAQIARDLGLELDGGEGAFSSILRDGKVHAFAHETSEEYLRSLFTPEEFASLKNWIQLAESLHLALMSSGLGGELAALNDISFAAWLVQLNLPPRVIEFIRMTLECEMGGPSESFSAISGLAELRVFLFGGEDALHVVGGNQRVAEALAQRIRGDKTLGARVTAIERSKDARGQLGVKLTYIRHGQVQSFSAERVIVAVPWTMLHGIMLDPPLPAEAHEGLTSLDRGQFVPVHFIVDQTIHELWGGAEHQPFPVLTSGPLGVIYGVGHQRSRPEQRNEVFSLLVHGDAAAAFHMTPRERKRDELIAELDAIWPGFSRHVRGSAIYSYHPAAVPLWPPGRSPYDARALALFQSFEGLYLAGDYLVSSHSDGAVIAARHQAAAVARDLSEENPRPEQILEGM
jgi:monoamine oxidase